jgi:hypothetical protein
MRINRVTRSTATRTPAIKIIIQILIPEEGVSVLLGVVVVAIVEVGVVTALVVVEVVGAVVEGTGFVVVVEVLVEGTGLVVVVVVDTGGLGIKAWKALK